jgi:urease accessory protein
MVIMATLTNIDMYQPDNITREPLALNRLLQLCSANLPVGGFSFSQGLEFAVEKHWVKDVQSTYEWIELTLTQSIARTDLVIINRLYSAIDCIINNQDFSELEYWNQHAIACRESNELLLADTAMGKALIRLITQLNALNTDAFTPFFANKKISFITAFAIAAYAFKLSLTDAQSGFCWTYIDNQVAAATKLVPLGQTQAQNLLFDLSVIVESGLTLANNLDDNEIGASLPRLAMASAWHENQYTRLFRS